MVCGNCGDRHFTDKCGEVLKFKEGEKKMVRATLSREEWKVIKKGRGDKKKRRWKRSWRS